MNKEQSLLMVIDDLLQKLADAERRESDYKVQSYLYAQRVQELEAQLTDKEGKDVT